MKATTVQLFNLFYETGLLQHTSRVDTKALIEAMILFEDLRYGEHYFECIHYNKEHKPIAHVAGTPTHNDNIWLFSQHCSVVPGHGLSIMEDVWYEVCNRPEIEYIVGGYNPKNKGAKKIWDFCYEIIGNDDICSRHPHNLKEGIIKPIGSAPNLFVKAFGKTNYSIVKFIKLFSRPTGYIPEGGSNMEVVIFRICDESKKKFRKLFGG